MVSHALHKSSFLSHNKFFKVACVDSTLLVVVFPRCMTLSVHAQTNFSFTLSRMVLSMYFNKSEYFSHIFQNFNTASAYNSFVDELVVRAHASIIWSTITPGFTTFPPSFATSHIT